MLPRLVLRKPLHAFLFSVETAFPSFRFPYSCHVLQYTSYFTVILLLLAHILCGVAAFFRLFNSASIFSSGPPTFSHQHNHWSLSFFRFFFGEALLQAFQFCFASSQLCSWSFVILKLECLCQAFQLAKCLVAFSFQVFALLQMPSISLFQAFLTSFLCGGPVTCRLASTVSNSWSFKASPPTCWVAFVRLSWLNFSRLEISFSK